MEMDKGSKHIRIDCVSLNTFSMSWKDRLGQDNEAGFSHNQQLPPLTPVAASSRSWSNTHCLPVVMPYLNILLCPDPVQHNPHFAFLGTPTSLISFKNLFCIFVIRHYVGHVQCIQDTFTDLYHLCPWQS